MFNYVPELSEARRLLKVAEQQLDFIRVNFPQQDEYGKWVLAFKVEAAGFDFENPHHAHLEWEMQGEHIEYLDRVLPQIIINPFIITLWSVYESSLRNIAAYIQKKREVSLSLQDIRGKHFVDAARKYFEQVLGVSFDYTPDRKEELDFLAGLRNTIVHRGGLVIGLTKRQAEAIGKSNIAGVSVAENFPESLDYLVLSEEYAEKAHAVIQEHASHLLDQAESAYVAGRSKLTRSETFRLTGLATRARPAVNRAK